MNSKQFLKEGFIEDAHEAHMDHEVQMARVDCYYAAEHAIVLHKLLRNISEEQGLEGWVASKITLANDYLKSVREHLEYQMMNTDADEEDFLPLAEGLTSVKKKLSEAADSKDIQEFERGPWYIIVKGEVVPEDDGSPRKFNWLNAAKVFFRKMLDDDPTTAAQLKSEYDNATDKKSVVYYSKKLPSASSDNSSLEESEKRPGLWANIRAKRERIKAGSGERMRKPGSKGAPTNKDLKSIRASSESMHEDGLNLDKKKSDFKNSLNLNLGSVRGLPINAGIQSAQTPQSYSNRPGASSMGLQPSLSIGNPESGPFAQISKQGGMVGYKKTFEGLGPEQKRVGQLGPTEKVKKNSGARGKLVGANESVEQGVAEGSLKEDEYDKYENGQMGQEEAVAAMFTRLARQGIDPIDMIANRFGWSTYELDDLAQQQGFENTAEWLNSFEQGVAEGSNDLYQKAIRKYAQQVANDYLNGGNEYLYGANKFDAEMFGVSQEKANKDFKTWFTMIVRSQAVRPRRGVTEDTQSEDVDQITRDFVQHYENDPMGVFMHAKSSYLDAVGKAKHFSRKAAALYKSHANMSKQEFQDTVMKYFGKHLQNNGFPPHASEDWGKAEHELVKELINLDNQGVAEGSSDKVHLKTPKHGLADHPGRNTGVGLSTFAATSEQDRCPKCNSLYKNHYQKQGVAASKDKSDKKS
jgi:hypothetical protein